MIRKSLRTFIGRIVMAAGLLTPLTVLGTPAVANAQPVTPPSQAVLIANKTALWDNCILGRTLTIDAPVIQYPCRRYADQLWTFTRRGTEPSNGEDYYQIQNVNNGLCLAVRTDKDNAGAQQVRCGNYYDQSWFVDLAWDGLSYQLRNRGSDKCLLVRGTAPYTQLQQYKCGTYTDQVWSFFTWA
ncbi:hypothetical protein Misp01_24030 [Microtetraspora sp. NBRC 13810]|uniref:RICIN domain-containing protein n=1 Tax=Microtetraspora sp. NBRC 13810 TaxID=3030990 RepID=UPI0024A190CB|nr:RICIN domain-containing protein [Microtetraspora sp. NBRC 13810]GLW07273.1 hypothetical protein Misp01_24030 [Microtetraspora sp. NBRC 13810]